MRRNALVSSLFISLVAACSSTPEAPLSTSSDAGRPAPKPLTALTGVKVTTESIIAAAHAVDAMGALDPRQVGAMQKLLDGGYGDIKLIAGEPVIPLTLDGSPPPAPGANPKLLTRFVHLCDIQLADDESPARLCNFDTQSLSSGAFRPQEGHECRILNAAVRTINALDKVSPISFVLLGGDNADNAQSNELDWFQAIMEGSPSVECDSGNDDDPVPGPDNDPKDPFVAEGLKVPWRWVTGNHDVLKQGNIPVAGDLAEPIGTKSVGGTRDWSQAGGPIVTGEVVPDPRRAFLDRHAMLAKVAANQDGHGIDAKTLAYGKAYYSFDVAGTPLRIVVMDTAAETGGSEGVVHQADVDKFLKPALDMAKAESKLVILTSHHVSESLTDGSDFGGELQADALTIEQFQTFVGGYDNVIMHLAAHSHLHRLQKAEPAGMHAYWELQTAALADFPHQMRVVEIWDQDDGYVTIRGLALDYSTENDAVAADGRKHAVSDYTSGWVKDGRGAATDRNVELWIKKPQ